MKVFSVLLLLSVIGSFKAEKDIEEKKRQLLGGKSGYPGGFSFTIGYPGGKSGYPGGFGFPIGYLGGKNGNVGGFGFPIGLVEGIEISNSLDEEVEGKVRIRSG